MPRTPHAVLPRLYEAAVAAVAPGPAVRRALEQMELLPQRWTRLLAVGKAAVPMAVAAAAALRERGHRVRDGLIVPPRSTSLADPALTVVAGDHPIPAAGSAAAARAVERFCADGREGDLVIVLLSGGTSSLLAAPVEGLPAGDLGAIFQSLLGAGLPVGEVNRVRRRFCRWAGGRLGAALAPAERLVLALSDVPGDHLPDIGSGPLSPDPDSAPSLESWLEEAGLLARLPPSAAQLLADTTAGRYPETPQPGDPRLEGVSTHLIASNRDALRGAAEAARRLGVRAEVQAEFLQGEAADVGRALARGLREAAAAGQAECRIWGAEPHVTLPAGPVAPGGRCQELALAAAEVLAESRGAFPALLAAGTDGTDGPTDAAGAIVTPATWPRIAATGRDPARDLARHESHRALDAAGALLRPGPTGTNVMDLVIALTAPPAA